MFPCVPRLRSSSRICCADQSLGLAGADRPLERFFGIEEDCDRTFIDQLHGHHSLKYSAAHRDTKGLQGFAEFLVELFGKCGRAGGNEGGAALAACVAIQSELRDHQRGALCVEDGAVHFALIVLEDAEIADFFWQGARHGRGVGVAYAEKDHQAESDFTCDAALDGDFGAADPLDDGARYFSSGFCWSFFRGFRGMRSCVWAVL